MFTVIGEFLLKFGVLGTPTGEAIGIITILTSYKIILGVALIVIAALLWIVGMSKFQLSFMYPFLSLNYVLIIVGSEIILKENVQINRYISILLIIVGLVFISRSSNQKVKE
tara:strand:- start:239 stop:574 length:336 start_codon:yes stop_codon:yes gene_type:complete